MGWCPMVQEKARSGTGRSGIGRSGTAWFPGVVGIVRSDDARSSLEWLVEGSYGFAKALRVGEFGAWLRGHENDGSGGERP